MTNLNGTAEPARFGAECAEQDDALDLVSVTGGATLKRVLRRLGAVVVMALVRWLAGR